MTIYLIDANFGAFLALYHIAATLGALYGFGRAGAGTLGGLRPSGSHGRGRRPPPPKWWDPIMSRVIAVVACGFTLAACSTSHAEPEFSQISAADARRCGSNPIRRARRRRPRLGQTCRTPCELTVRTRRRVLGDACAQRVSAADRVGAPPGDSQHRRATRPGSRPIRSMSSCSRQAAPPAQKPAEERSRLRPAKPRAGADIARGVAPRLSGPAARSGRTLIRPRRPNVQRQHPADQLSADATRRIAATRRSRSSIAWAWPERWTLWPISVRIPI